MDGTRKKGRKLKSRPYAGGRWTEAQYKSFVRSALRRAWMRWPVKHDALKDARRSAIGRSKQTKWEYQCASCLQWYLGKEVQVDHIAECGSLDDAGLFIGRLFCEQDNLQVLCKGCHRAKGKLKPNR